MEPEGFVPRHSTLLLVLEGELDQTGIWPDSIQFAGFLGHHVWESTRYPFDVTSAFNCQTQALQGRDRSGERGSGPLEGAKKKPAWRALRRASF